MAGAQAKLGMRVLLNGIPSMLEFEDYTSAYPKKVMEGTRGGSFVAGEHWVGIEAMKGALTLKGATPAMLSQYGLTAGALIPVTIFETFRDEDGAVIQAQEIWQMAEITAIEQSNTPDGTATPACDQFLHQIGTSFGERKDRIPCRSQRQHCGLGAG